MIYGCRYTSQSGQGPEVRIIHGWQKIHFFHSSGWINQKHQTQDGCDFVLYVVYVLFPCHRWKVIFVSTFSLLQMEKPMSCAMGIPGPVHNPSCSSSQVLTSTDFFSCACGYFFVIWYLFQTFIHIWDKTNKPTNSRFTGFLFPIATYGSVLGQDRDRPAVFSLYAQVKFSAGNFTFTFNRQKHKINLPISLWNKLHDHKC